MDAFSLNFTPFALLWLIETLPDRVAITTWRALTIGRFVSVMVGWLVVCRILHRNSSRSADAIRESENLKHTLELARKRINQLTGAKLDKMGREDLLELAQTQRSALEQTEHVLDAMPKAAVDPFAMMQTTIKTGTYNPLNMLGYLHEGFCAKSAEEEPKDTEDSACLFEPDLAQDLLLQGCISNNVGRI